MDENILIKYDIDGEFHENKYYEILFDYHKSSSIFTFDYTYKEGDDFLKEIHGKKISVIYRGISKIDKKKIFILNSSSVRREYKLLEIFR